MWASRIGLNPGASKSNLRRKKIRVNSFQVSHKKRYKKEATGKNEREKFGQKTFWIDTFVSLTKERNKIYINTTSKPTLIAVRYSARHADIFTSRNYADPSISLGKWK
jgi:hypothetical protein